MKLKDDLECFKIRWALLTITTFFWRAVQKIQKWWILNYLACPVAWTVHGLIIMFDGNLANPIMVRKIEVALKNWWKEGYFGYQRYFG
ncbi:hypothetical protein SUGI_0541940 [Cryptomeria japonica]|uniref:ABC transporter G family member 29 n=1 Tax=Cryptomeria japonica TaxID=3369 RepID=UPI002408EFB9|nr:ABC transporter G family member 29 [Cryptomeria japonica]GLJ27621.1 hypothetical protein SUGI_0541940 [Cryptomeria japonica]